MLHMRAYAFGESLTLCFLERLVEGFNGASLLVVRELSGYYGVDCCRHVFGNEHEEGVSAMDFVRQFVRVNITKARIVGDEVACVNIYRGGMNVVIMLIKPWKVDVAGEVINDVI